VEIKTEVKSEIQPPRLSTRAPVPPEGGAAAPAAKRRRSGGASPFGGAFCRRSRPVEVPRRPLPPPPADTVDDRVATAAVGARPVLGFASGLGPTDPRPCNRAGPAGPQSSECPPEWGGRRGTLAQLEAAWEAQLARLAAYKKVHGDCSVPRGWAEDPRLGNWVGNQRTYKKKLDCGDPWPGMSG
jgi:hypothetical protein